MGEHKTATITQKHKTIRNGKIISDTILYLSSEYTVLEEHVNDYTLQVVIDNIKLRQLYSLYWNLMVKWRKILKNINTLV